MNIHNLPQIRLHRSPRRSLLIGILQNSRRVLEDIVRCCVGDIGCGVELTIVEVRDRLQNVAVGVERFWPTDATGIGIPVRVQDDLGIDEVSGGNASVQHLAKSSSGHHVCREPKYTASVAGPTYTME